MIEMIISIYEEDKGEFRKLNYEEIEEILRKEDKDESF